MSKLEAGKKYLTATGREVVLKETGDPKTPFETEIWGMKVLYTEDGIAVPENPDKDIVDMVAIEEPGP